MDSFIAIDFETTAFEVARFGENAKSEPWQLGAAIVENGRLAGTREWFFGTAMTPDFEPIEAQWEEIHSFLAAHPLVAHNIATERTILTRLAPLTKWGPWTDTLRIAKRRYPRLGSYKLGDLCELFGCVPDIEGRTWHDGLFDAVACANLALRIM